MSAVASPERGSALVASVVLGLALATAATALVAHTEQHRATSERARDRVAALAAAEVGIAEASARLVADRDFAARAASGDDLGDPALRRWVGLEGGSAYRYTLAVDGEVVRVLARGRAGGVERLVEAALRPRGFADLHRFTDIEVIDPSVVPGAPSVGCDRQRWAEPPRVAGCPEAAYGPSEVLAGDLHTNDVLLMRGSPEFRGSVSTAWLGEADTSEEDPLWRGIDPTAAPSFRSPPRHHGSIVLPAAPPTTLEPGDQGCHYHGPTVLRLDGDRMRVWSPGSAAPAPGAPATRPECGAGTLGGRVSVDIPGSGIIRVHRRAPGCTTHPLGLDRTEEHDGGYGCANGDVFVWGTYDAPLTIVADDDAHLVWDLLPADGGRGSDDVLGIVAGRSIIVRRPVSPPVRGSAPYGRNLNVAGPGIGPFGAYPLDAPTAVASPWSEPRLEAHLLALGRSVRIQNPARGQRNPGTLVIRGSVAQRFRGPFELTIPGTTLLTGYASRTEPRVGPLRSAPPGFPSLDDATWVRIAWNEPEASLP